MPASTLEDCANGSCSQCGLCCIAYSITVPSVRGDIDSPSYEKARGEVCPQLIRDVRGRYQCALHAEKMAGDPRLQVCRNWNGGEIRTIELIALTESWAQKPPDVTSAETLEDFVRRNLHDVIDIRTEYANAVSVVRHYLLNLGICPTAIFEALEIRDSVRRMSEESPREYQKFDREIWEHCPELYAAFFENYIWETRHRTRYRDPAFAGP